MAASVNFLYYGDNLDVLRRHIKDDSVHLVYLDPPFESSQAYNILFAEQDGSKSASQFKAFEDTWEWNQAAAAAGRVANQERQRIERSEVIQSGRVSAA